jgi:hypothetical protein
MMELLAVAGVLSGAAVLIRELRLLMGEVRRWRKSSIEPSRKPRRKK